MHSKAVSPSVPQPCFVYTRDYTFQRSIRQAKAITFVEKQRTAGKIQFIKNCEWLNEINRHLP